MGLNTGYSNTLNADTGGWNGYTLVNEFAIAGLSLPSLPIVGVRCTFQAAAATEGLTITNAYIGHKAASGDAYDFAATPTQLLFGGAAGYAIGIGSQQVTDFAPFAYNKTSNLLVAFYVNGGASVDTLRYIASGVSNVNSWFRAATNEAGTVNKTTGYTANAGRLLAINKIEFLTIQGESYYFTG